MDAALQEAIEGGARQPQQFGVAQGDHGGGARLVRDERHLADRLARSDFRQEVFRAVHCCRDRGPAREDEANALARDRLR